MNRLTFLKSLGFKGASLMALLTACTKEEDSYVEALTVDANNRDISLSNEDADISTPADSSSNGTGTTQNGIPTSVILSLDLAETANAVLKTVGGYIIKNRIVVAQTSTGNYVAATQTCSHEPKNRVIYRDKEWYCTDHGARYTLQGAGLNSKGSRGLTVYKVTQIGQILYIS